MAKFVKGKKRSKYVTGDVTVYFAGGKETLTVTALRGNGKKEAKAFQREIDACAEDDDVAILHLFATRIKNIVMKDDAGDAIPFDDDVLEWIFERPAYSSAVMQYVIAVLNDQAANRDRLGNLRN